MLRHAIHAAYRFSVAGSARRFRAALEHPAAAQHRRLRAFLALIRGTAYSREHKLDGISDFADFQRRVPIVGYDELSPYVERIAAGESRVLTRSTPRMMEQTSGSTQGRKWVPYTPELLSELSAATGPWLFGLYQVEPGLRGTQHYWSISPVTRAREVTTGGLPIGFEDDSEYFGPLSRWALRQLFAVPTSVRLLTDTPTWRMATLRHLLAAEQLGLISVWSPSFLTLLMETLQENLEPVLASLPPARRHRIQESLADEGRLVGEALWSRLRVISCWTDGPSAMLVPRLRRWFPRTRIQPKGLLATEGVVTLPWPGATDRGALPALNSHVIELLNLESPGATPLPVHAAREGAAYVPILSTGGGFARYRMGDVLRCTGHLGATPLFRFEGRCDRVTDVRGEKLNAHEVEAKVRELASAFGLRLDFALLAPIDTEPPHYRLFAESSASDAALTEFAEGLERALARGHHYRYCRDLGQLGPIQLSRVRSGQRTYERALVDHGARLGDIKPTMLDGRPIWAAAFRVTELS